MQLLNPKDFGPEECREAIWELIPWYVNGSLPSDKAEAVRSHSTNCTLCAAEILRQSRLAKGVITVDPFDVPLSRSWKSLRAQIKAEERVRSPKVSIGRRFGRLQGGLIACASVAVVACAVILMQPINTGFETLTSGGETAMPIIKFQAAPGVAQERLNQVLAQFGVTLLSGPSATGVYTVTVPKGADLLTISDALMATPQIAFAAPQVAQ